LLLLRWRFCYGWVTRLLLLLLLLLLCLCARSVLSAG
jgi:hypothetical protein